MEKEIKTSEKAIERASMTGHDIIKTIRIDGKTTKHILQCGNCQSKKAVPDSTLTRWYKQGLEYCSACRGTGKGLTTEQKLKQLNDVLIGIYKEKLEVVEYLGYVDSKRHSFCNVKFIDCSHVKTYNCTTLRSMVKDGKAFKCDICGSKAQSTQESWSDNLLGDLGSKQVPYRELFESPKDWIADYVVDNLIIEITTIGQLTKPEYLQNMINKVNFASSNGYLVLTVTNLNHVQDIVRAYRKL